MIEKTATARRPYAAIALFALAYVAALAILVAPHGTFTASKTHSAASISP